MSSPGHQAQIPRWQLWLIVTSAVVSVIALAFLTGYEVARSGKRSASDNPEAPQAALAPPVPPAVSAAPPTHAAAIPAPVTAGETPKPQADSATAPPGAASTAEVAAYFAESDAILQSAKQDGDPNTLAQKILEQAVSGDSAGLDRMVAAQRSLAARLSGIRVPAPCAEHHRRTLALLAKGADLLQQAGSVIHSGDTSGLAALAMGGQQIEGEARALDALATRVRGQYGLR